MKNEHEEFVEELIMHIAESIITYENYQNVGIAFSSDLDFLDGRTLYIILKEDDKDA